MVKKRREGAPGGAVHGVLVVDKPSGMTSHDVVAQLRRVYRTRRVGHAGTLDPMATGVLVLLLGEATKLSSVLTTQTKEYVTTIRLGIGTSSFDADGDIAQRRPIPEDVAARLAAALDQERARTLQLPPAVSAIKVDGRRAYQLARAGIEVDLAPRPVQVHRLELLEQDPQTVTLRLLVSKGYYVRALARDLAEALGTVGHLTALRRVRSGPFTESGSHALPLQEPAPLLPLLEAVRRALPTLEVSLGEAQALREGKPLPYRPAAPSANGPDGSVVAAWCEDRMIALIAAKDGALAEGAPYWVLRGIHDPGPEPGSGLLSLE